MVLLLSINWFGSPVWQEDREGSGGGAVPGPWNTAAQRGYAAKARNAAAAATYDQLARQADNPGKQSAARGSSEVGMLLAVNEVPGDPHIDGGPGPFGNVADQHQAAGCPGQCFTVDQLHIGVGHLDRHVNHHRHGLRFVPASTAGPHHILRDADRSRLSLGRFSELRQRFRVDVVALVRTHGSGRVDVDQDPACPLALRPDHAHIRRVLLRATDH
ncbi:hypothetical protein SAMN04515691_0679 [Leifsonia sp. 98AMF]|nr:hypothetical protein SAMN04515691_0679 [Leifsonia sp. 98AMF]